MMENKFTILIKPFAELTPFELYDIIRLRNEVFVVEQNCVFQDADEKDLSSHHLMVCDNKKLVAYCRLLPPGLAFEQISIGRVTSSPPYRRTGVGKILMTRAIVACNELFGDGPISIGAQLYLKKFYESFGFAATSDIYLEDNIEHIEMMKNQ